MTSTGKVLFTATTGDEVVGGKLIVNYLSGSLGGGDQGVAEVTSKNYVRMFTVAGLQWRW